MPQIPGLPIDEPVEKPQASPRQFGSVGATIAGLGEETEDLAAGASAVAGHLIAAQRQVHAKQAEIAFDRMKMQVYQDLNKTTTPEEAQAVYDHAKGRLDDTLTPFEHDRELAKALGIYRQQQDVEIQGTVNAKKADIITKSDKAANEVLYSKSQQDAITTTVGGGNPAVARDKLNLQLQSSVSHGTLLPVQADAVMQQWDQDYEKGMIEAYANSPDGNVRKGNIQNLKSGDSYPHLDAATKNALLTKSENRDRELANLHEAEDLNASSSKFNQLTEGWDYSHKIDATSNDKWAKDNGFVDENGNPNRKILDKIGEDVDRQEVRSRKVQTDNDNDIVEKYMVDVSSGKMSETQIQKAVMKDGGSPKAITYLNGLRKDIIRTDLELGSLSLQRQSLLRQQWQDQSFDQLGVLQRDLANGVRHSREQINDMVGRGPGKLSSQQAAEAIRMTDSYETDPVNKPYYTIISNSTALDDKTRGEAVSEFDRYVQQHPTADSTAKQRAINEIIDPKNVERINKSLDGLGDVFNPSPSNTPQKPGSVPDNAVWNPKARQWQLPQ